MGSGFSRKRVLKSLIWEGKCLRRRAKPAHFGRHLPITFPPAFPLTKYQILTLFFLRFGSTEKSFLRKTKSYARNSCSLCNVWVYSERVELRLVMRRVLVSPELADVGHGWLAVERERTSGDESVVFKHLARGRIVQRDPRAQPGESVLCGGKLAHLAHRRCG